MKKTIALIALMMAAMMLLLTGCGADKAATTEPAAKTEEAAPATEEAPAEEAAADETANG